MKIVSVGGGPAGLYFAVLMKRADPAHDVVVLERNRPSDTFGFGVVFSDATLSNLAAADPPTHDAIERSFHHWDDIEIRWKDEVLRSTGHGFAGVSRARLLEILEARARELGVRIDTGTEVADLDAFSGADLVLGADGVNSVVRRLRAETFRPTIDERPNKFVWLGTTRPFPAFTFVFKRDAHGLWRVHAYQYERGRSTFIVEATRDTFDASGLDPLDEAATVRFCEELFAEELAGHPLIANRSLWRSFPTVRCERWRAGNVVLVGDAAHTAHFSVGSGTKLALEDAIALQAALARRPCVDEALAAYEAERRPAVESLQRAAQQSLQWFESTERYVDDPPLRFAFSLLTRSLRITHQELAARDPAFVRSVDERVAGEAERQSGVRLESAADARVPPPMFTPFRLRDLVLGNRVVVSAMCQYSATDGRPNDWHLVHLGSRAVGGAGLVMTEMTDVSADARISPGCCGMYRDEHVGAWRRIVDFVHGACTAKIGIQLAHAGRKGATKVPWEGEDPLDDGAWPLVAPSDVAWDEDHQIPRAMTREDLARVKADFVRATERAIEAGFDLVELHFAHGYLFGSFISPLTNRRTDEYGGSLANRLRYPLEVLDAIRAVWPAERPISVRISATDWAPGGVEPEDAVEVARMLKAHGVDLVDVSAGGTVPFAAPAYGRQYQTPFADRIRHEADIATMAVGNISSWMDVNTIVAAGRADLCALARANLYDPYWTRHAAAAQGWALRWPDPYSTLTRYVPRLG
ncbi:MAG: bifunctional salicylyl-CoA 5-hydroxylase/oxidoreductase [bacterium]